MSTNLSKRDAASTPMPAHEKRNMILFGVIALAILVLYQIPYGRYVIYPISLLFTYVHEMGHGLTAILVGGEFDRFLMWADGSGVAYTLQPNNGFKRAMIAAGGLINPPIIAAILFFFSRYVRGSKITLGVFGALVALSGILYVRNLFGFFFVAVLAAFCLFMAIKFSAHVSQIVLLVMAIGLSTSTFSRSDYLFVAAGNTGAGQNMTSDTQAMANHLFLPYWFWGAIVALLSLAVLVMGVYVYFKRPKALPNEGKSE